MMKTVAGRDHGGGEVSLSREFGNQSPLMVATCDNLHGVCSLTKQAHGDCLVGSATFDVGRDDGVGSRRNPLGVTLYEDL